MTDRTGDPSSSGMQHWLAAGALVWSGCYVHSETIRTDRKVSERFGPPDYEGLATPRLAVQFSGAWIQLLATAVRPCTRDKIEVVDEQVVTHVEVTVPPYPSSPDPFSLLITAGMMAVMVPVTIISGAIAIGRRIADGEGHRHSETSVKRIRTECAEPLAGARVHLAFVDGPAIDAVTDAQGRVSFDIPVEAPRRGNALASLDGTDVDVVVPYEASPGQAPEKPAPQASDGEDPR